MNIVSGKLHMSNNGSRKGMAFKTGERASKTVSCTRECEIHQIMCGIRLDFRRSLVSGLPSPRIGVRAPFPNSGWQSSLVWDGRSTYTTRSVVAGVVACLQALQREGDRETRS